VRRGLTAVGDDDQSIYAWRGARPENLRQLQADFPDLKVIKLEQNYRSTGRILAAANRLIAGNPHVFEKRLWSELGPGDPIRVVECRDELHEAERVVGELIHDRFQQRAAYADYAILFRGNHQARPFEKALREHGIPYVLAGGQSFFAYTEVKDLLAYLRLLANPQDSAAFFRIANVPRREIGPSTLERLAHYAADRGIGPLAACLELGLEAQVGPRPLSRLRQLAEWLTASAARATRTDPAATARALVEDLGYAGWLRSQYDEPQAERRLANVQELLGWLERLTHSAEGEIDLSGLMAQITLLDVLDRADAESTGDRVTLTTLHAAKGLEFPHVFMVGMEEDLLPHRTSIEEETIEEERRLAYVGLTRARRRLTLTLAKRRRRYGELTACEPSRFLAELPPEHLEWEGEHRPVDPERRRARGEAHLAVLRGLLAGE
jgi:ATP-dependent DNA helicase Rep